MLYYTIWRQAYYWQTEAGLSQSQFSRAESSPKALNQVLLETSL